MKINRNTSLATAAASQAKTERRLRLKKRILEKICPDFCPHDEFSGDCKDGCPPNGTTLLGCRSAFFIADHLTLIGMEKLSGKEGKWFASNVETVFKEEAAQWKAISADKKKRAFRSP